LQNKQYYINEFKSKLQSWRIGTADKAWYRPRFEWRVAFNFNEERYDCRYSHKWRELLEICETNQWQFRRRAEGYCTIFTSELAFLDLILSSEEWIKFIAEVQYSNDTYLKEFANNAGIDAITDIKFVARLPEHFYQVTLGNFEWRTDDSLKLSLMEYLIVNRQEYIFKGYEQEMVTRMVKAHEINSNPKNYYNSGMMNGFKFWAKSTDDILMLHMMAPGKIVKIVKLMEKTV
jgi:hypothetical protein